VRSSRRVQFGNADGGGYQSLPGLPQRLNVAAQQQQVTLFDGALGKSAKFAIAAEGLDLDAIVFG
jgi:hypothetical protein